MYQSPDHTVSQDRYFIMKKKRANLPLFSQIFLTHPVLRDGLEIQSLGGHMGYPALRDVIQHRISS
jgi:hypothetical protein